MRTPRAALLAALPLLLVAACGSRLSADERAEVLASQGGAAAADGGELAVGAVGAVTSTTAGAAGQGGGSAAGGGSGGTGGSAAGAGGSAAACRSSGKASDVGVSATTIKIGNISTIGGPVPGFGQTGRNGVRAYIAKVNAEGGVCGRALELVNGDDRLEAGVNRSETQRLVKSVFAFAGNTTVVDDGGAGSLGNTPDVSLSISDARIKAPTNFSPSPIDLTVGGNGTEKIFRWFKQNDKVGKGGIIWPSQASARNRAQAYIKDMEAAGITVPSSLRKEVSITETNYSGFAAAVANEKADIIISVLEVNGMARLARAFQTEGYTPKVPFYGAQAYGQKFLKSAGPAANGTKIGVAYSIIEGAQGQGPKDFATWYPRANPGADPDYFAIQGWIAADMLVTALRGAGPDPTRDKVLVELRKQTAYEASGFVGKINPAQKRFAPCFAIVGVEGGRWKRIFPASGFQC
jgi:ABC-type branched-subunit amino acid transport system substrate-binding protein